ncbi:MAG: SEL1-like repeat protein [Oxalobacter sp.]|nr:SEL1-like repeat protein [Oxalobacter sp.]
MMRRFLLGAGLLLAWCFPAAAVMAASASCDAIMAGTLKNSSMLDRAACHIIAKAEAGDAEAQYEAGLVYSWGVDALQPDPDVAAAWLMKAAQGGQAEAAYRLAAFYVDGYGVKQNMEEAYRWFETAANAGSSLAMFELGGMLEYGLGVERDTEKARQWYGKARELHNHEAEVNQVLEERDLMENPWDAAKSGEAKAQYYAGLVKWQEARSALAAADRATAYAEAVKWYAQSAAQGYAPAQSALGLACARGVAGKADEETAAIWYARAAKQGYAEARYQLAILYVNGLGVQKDEAKALGLFIWAAEHEHSEAQRLLAAMYETGMGVKANRVEARKWHRRSAQQNNVALRDMLRLTDMP